MRTDFARQHPRSNLELTFEYSGEVQYNSDQRFGCIHHIKIQGLNQFSYTRCTPSERRAGKDRLIAIRSNCREACLCRTFGESAYQGVLNEYFIVEREAIVFAIILRARKWVADPYFPQTGWRLPAGPRSNRVPLPLVKPDKTTQQRLSEAYGKLPLSFEAKTGSAILRVKFISRAGGQTLFLTSTDAVLKLGRSGQPRRPPISYHQSNLMIRAPKR